MRRRKLALIVATTLIVPGGIISLLLTPGDVPDKGNPNLSLLLFRTLLCLVVVVGMIFLMIFMLRKFLYRNKRTGDEHLKVLGSTFLGPKKSVCLVKVMDRILVLGVTESSITLLSEMGGDAALQVLESLSQKETGASSKGFPYYLNSILKRIR